MCFPCVICVDVALTKKVPGSKFGNCDFASHLLLHTVDEGEEKNS